MTDQPPARVRFARRFVAKIPGQPDIHGVQFPDSGHVIADVAYTGLTGFLTVDVIADEYEGAVIHWADETGPVQPAPAATEATNQPAHDGGPTVQEATTDDRRWPLEKAGE